MVSVVLLDVSSFMVKTDAIIDKNGRGEMRKNKESRLIELTLNQEVHPDPGSIFPASVADRGPHGSHPLAVGATLARSFPPSFASWKIGSFDHVDSSNSGLRNAVSRKGDTGSMILCCI